MAAAQSGLYASVPLRHNASWDCDRGAPIRFASIKMRWRIATLSNLNRFLLGTHHKVEQKHLPSYVAEFNCRLNRRTMERDLMVRLLCACIGAQTITYKQLTSTPEVA